MKFYLQQFKFYRYFKGGHWVLVATHLSMGTFWCEAKDMPKCCGSHVVGEEYYYA